MNDDPATLCKFLDERCRAELDRLSASLTQLSSEADTIRRYRTWVEGFSIADNSDVNGAMAIWGKAAETVQRLNAIDRELRRYYQFDSPKGRHSRTAAFLLNTNSLQALYLVLEAEELVRVCRAFATAAARQRGIIGAGAELTDDAYRELAITVQSSGLSSTLPTVAPPPAPPPPAALPPAGARTSEGGTPSADPFAGLRQFARCNLKGQERAVIDALCNMGGEMPIADLAIADGVGWDDPFNGFRNTQQRLNPKLKPQGWTLARQNNAAMLNPMKS